MPADRGRSEAVPPTPLPGAPDRGWNRRVLRIAGPIILSNLSVPLLGAVDTAAMGHQPDAAYLGGVAIGALFFSFIYWGFGFLRMGTTGFAAQVHGASDGDELAATLLRPLAIGAGLGALIVILQAPLARLALELMDPGTQVAQLARDYIDIRIWGAPATLMLYAILGWQLGVQRPAAVLLLQLLLNGSNIAITLLLVVGLGWRIEGAATGTLIAEYMALAFGLWLARRALKDLAARVDWSRLGDRVRLVALLRVNTDIFIRTACLQVVFALFARSGAQFGEATLAGNAVLLQFQSFLAFGLDGFAHAVEVLAGSAVGARSRRAFRSAVTVSSIWALAFAGLFTLIYALGGPMLIALFTDLPEVRAVAGAMLPWIIASPLISVWSYQLDGIFIGATRTAAMRNAMILSLIGFLVAERLLTPSFGNNGLWAALLIFMGLRGLTLGAYYPGLERSLEKKRI
ncbi:MATE family efflux transporter [Algihabitans albus]|uniref:MATE family efflux transporter n=1 Tax=Algihabitans albus TaxID=2164067 RepID=UPI001F39A276|nr:MATE family efflux transporter [Algihabitans albus]